jgi:hypothetical protein
VIPDHVLEPCRAPGIPPERPLTATCVDGAVTIDTGIATFSISRGGAFPLSEVVVAGQPALDPESTQLLVHTQLAPTVFVVQEVTLHDAGPVRAEVSVRGRTEQDDGCPLEVWARVEFFSGRATARIEVTFRNPRRARHPGGVWVLGDEGSVEVQFAELQIGLSSRVRRLQHAAEHGQSPAESPWPLEIHQESSGGERWDSGAHRDRTGAVPLRFRGYRLRARHVDRAGLRASPTVVAETRDHRIAVAVPQFWQNFPRAITVDERRIGIGLFARQSARPHELQGGEQKTHRIAVDFVGDMHSDQPLEWVHEPMVFLPPVPYCCETGAVPFLVPEADDPNRAYVAFARQAIEGPDSFFAKREQIDEYGWRNFGDLFADHESAFEPADSPNVSHYNNQYDAIGAFVVHLLRSADRRWHDLMADLVGHVRDVDIYHARDDKAAYNGGLFWHTQHHIDADTSTHRTYPRGTTGGGPSAEHNYNQVLMLHYFLTGDRASRDAAIGLGQWVIDMDDGRLTSLRWLSRAPTGLASATRSKHYHGPGRGAGNSIAACIVAHRLSGDRRFLEKAEELIRRTVGPGDDIEARRLLDVESRWSYTVHLQALGDYLDYKAELGQLDDMFGWARESLLHYARWMAANERPYLSRPELLDFPDETWVAQDLRKADVFWRAARVAESEEREYFLASADRFFGYSVETLSDSEGPRLTRPLVIALANGWRLANPPPALHRPAGISLGAKRGEGFKPQERLALRNGAIVLSTLASILALLLLR